MALFDLLMLEAFLIDMVRNRRIMNSNYTYLSAHLDKYRFHSAVDGFHNTDLVATSRLLEATSPNPVGSRVMSIPHTARGNLGSDFDTAVHFAQVPALRLPGRRGQVPSW